MPERTQVLHVSIANKQGGDVLNVSITSCNQKGRTTEDPANFKKIREALDRIEKGTYGVCEECEDEISEQRLMARPVSTLCIECKTSQEEDERWRGEYTDMSVPYYLQEKDNR